MVTPSSSTSQVNAITTSTTQSHYVNALTASDRIGLTGLNDDQWKTLVTMLNECKPSSTTEKLTGTDLLSYWIIDTRATNHMTSSLQFLYEVHDMAPLPVKLSDGRITLATRQGTIVLSSMLTL